jgi:LysM repeat protein
VTVRPGDTLTGIASRYHVAVASFAAANHLRNLDHIEIGSRLTLPGTGSAPAASGSYVTVAPGDTLSSIASRYATTVGALLALNHLSNPNNIYAGARLALPSLAGGDIGDDFVLTAYSSPVRQPTSTLAPIIGPSDRPSTTAIRASLAHWSRHYGLPNGLLQGLTWWESGWQSGIVSSTGAIGIGQLEPYTVTFVRNVLIGDQRLNPRVADDNIRMSAAFLHSLLSRAGGDQKVAIAAYYQGFKSVIDKGPLPDTKHYVAGILAYARLFAAGLWQGP